MIIRATSNQNKGLYIRRKKLFEKIKLIFEKQVKLLINIRRKMTSIRFTDITNLGNILKSGWINCFKWLCFSVFSSIMDEFFVLK